MSKIEQELVKATGTKPNKDRVKFLTSLLKGANAITDEDWEKLSEPASKWINLANKAVEAEKAIPDFAADKEDTKDEPKAEPKAKGRVKAAEAEAEEDTKAEKKAKPAPAKKEAKPAVKKGPGKLEKLKGIILKNLKAKPEELQAKVTAAGIEVSTSTVTTVRSDFLSTIRVLQKAGALAKDLVEID